jgi:hypothetical protein
LHWSGKRSAKVLYIDGEMSSCSLQERIRGEHKRSGISENLIVLSRMDCEGMPPLNTPEGQVYIDRVFEETGAELVFFDNIQALLTGNMKDEDAWALMLEWITSLTHRRIGQVWLHHTGMDKTHGYGTNTREWRMDAVALMEAVERSDADVSFKLIFTKARERNAANHSDFEPVYIALINGVWIGDQSSSNSQSRVKLSPTDQKFLEVLTSAIATWGTPVISVPGHPQGVNVETWRNHLVDRGYLEPRDEKGRWTQRSSADFSRYSRNLFTAGVAIQGYGYVWLRK